MGEKTNRSLQFFVKYADNTLFIKNNEKNLTDVILIFDFHTIEINQCKSLKNIHNLKKG